MFGPHLILEGYDCLSPTLSDVGLISDLLDKFPAQIGMTKIMPPYVFKYEGLVPEDQGVSGIVLIAESHIAVHSFSEKGFIALDIFSCKDFDVEVAINYFCNVFRPKKIEKQVLARGYHFPRTNISRLVDSERSRINSP